MPQVKIAKLYTMCDTATAKKQQKREKSRKCREKRKKETKKFLESLFVPTTFYVNADAESLFPHDRKKNEKKKKNKMSENTNRFQDIGFGVLNLKF